MRGGGGLDAAAARVPRCTQSMTLRTLSSYAFPPENKSRYAKVDAVREVIGFLFIWLPVVDGTVHKGIRTLFPTVS